MGRTGRRPGAGGTREKILAAARFQFSEAGYEGATIRDIAGEAGVDPALVLAPTLVLCGERDKANLPLTRSLADALPNATLELVPDAGHVANLDNPAAFTTLVADFLSSG